MENYLNNSDKFYDYFKKDRKRLLITILVKLKIITN